VDRSELDLRDQTKVRAFFEKHTPDAVFLAAAVVGGIKANDTYRWEFLYENLTIQNNVISAALEFGAERLVFFGSSCIYPRLAPQPISEDALLTGPLEHTNEPYAIAKIAGLKLIESANAQYGKKWLSLMPTNLYGPNDQFDLERGHVLPAMISKFHNAKVQHERGEESTVVLWGSGSPLREFLHVDDLATATMVLFESEETGLYNIGSGMELTIRELAAIIAEVVGYKGKIKWDSSRPDGTPRKLLDSSRTMALGWRPEIDLRDGIRSAYEWFIRNTDRARTTARLAESSI